MILKLFLPILFGLSSICYGAAPAGETWFTLKTPNFRVHHTEPLETYARHFAFSLERGLPLLEKNLKWKAPTPIDIVITDPSDSANGLAVSFPNTHIEVYSTALEHDSVLSHYYDWVNELAVHELTHIIANDSALGFYLTLRKIFGSWVKPNGLQPSWMSEGLAVYEETSLTSGGRGRSPWINALLGEAVRAGKLTSKDYTSLDRFNDGNPWWPAGNMPYLLGYTIQASGVKKKANFPGELSLNNSGLPPFAPNRNAEEVVGQDWASLWQEADIRLRERYPNHSQKTCFITQSGRLTGGHALSSDGWVYFSEESWKEGVQLSRVRADAPCGNQNVERLYHKKNGGPSQVAVAEDGSLVAFSVTNLQRFEHFFNDLYLWHRDSGKVEQITDGKRARDPAFASGYLFYIYQNSDTSHSIRRKHLASGHEEDIYVAKPLERLAGLHARGKQIAFSLHNNKGQELLVRAELDGGNLHIATASNSRTHERNPHIAADGSVWFSGTFNSPEKMAIFRRAENNKTELIYREASGFVDRPIPLDKNTLLVQAYHLGGTDIARVNIADSWQGQDPKQDVHEFLTGEAPPKDTAPKAEELASVGTISPYKSTSTPATSLWPQYWMPEFAFEEDGFLAGASTSGNDPLNYHFYALRALYDSRATFPIYWAYYRNRTYPTAFHLELKQSNSYFASTKTSNRQALYSAEAVIPLGGYTSYTLGAAFQERTLFSRKGQSVIGYQSFLYENVGKKPAAVAPNYGEVLRLYAGVYPNARNERTFVDLRPLLGIYKEGFQPSHSMSLVARAGISTNRLLASNYYLGGGQSVLTDSDFVVRGYPQDTLFGQRIAAVNFAYTLPLAHPYRGWRTNPLFLENFGLSFRADAGSANYLAVYRDGLFYHYKNQRFGKKVLTGLGLDLTTNGSFFYHIPFSLVTGAHYGLQKDNGGGTLMFIVGVNVGMPGVAGSQKH